MTVLWAVPRLISLRRPQRQNKIALKRWSQVTIRSIVFNTQVVRPTKAKKPSAYLLVT